MSDRIKLTPGRIESAACPEGKQQIIVRDAEQPGLGLRVTAGSKSFIFQGKLAGRVIRMTLGDVQTLTLSEARDKAAELRAIIRAGRDPRVVRAEVTAADLAKRAQTEIETRPAMELWCEYMQHCSTRQKRPWSPRTLLDHERLTDPGGKPKTRGRKKGEGKTTQKGPLFDILQLPVVKIDAKTVEAWLKQNRHRPAVAEFGYVRLRAFVRWCARQGAYKGLPIAEAFTDDNVREQVPDLAARTDRLSRKDLAPWFEAVLALKNPVHAAYLQITLLTGCRRGELAPLRWGAVDFRNGAIRLSGKSGSRVIPMPPYIRCLLEGLRQRNEAGPRVVGIDGKRPEWKPSPFVFPSPTAESGYIEEPRYSHGKALEAAGVPHVSIHGLRRTFGSMSDSQGVDLPFGVVLQIQGHAPKGTAERHYRVRELEELAPWHKKYEAWLLEQAGVEQPNEESPELKAVVRSR